MGLPRRREHTAITTARAQGTGASTVGVGWGQGARSTRTTSAAASSTCSRRGPPMGIAASGATRGYRTHYPSITKHMRHRFTTILWVTTQTQLFLTQKKKSGAGEWPKLFRENNSKKQGLVCVPLFFPRGCSARCPVDRSWCAQRCCDGVAAATDMRRPAPSRSFCASRRADAAATELMLRAALLRRSCDGVAAATESLL